MRLIKSHASGRKLIACRGQEEVSFSPHAALHNWLSAVRGGLSLLGHWRIGYLWSGWLSPTSWQAPDPHLAAISSSSVCSCCLGCWPHLSPSFPEHPLHPYPEPHVPATASASFFPMLSALSHLLCHPHLAPKPLFWALLWAPTCWLGPQANKPGWICLSLSKADPSWSKKMCFCRAWGSWHRLWTHDISCSFFAALF